MRKWFRDHCMMLCIGHNKKIGRFAPGLFITNREYLKGYHQRVRPILFCRLLNDSQTVLSRLPGHASYLLGARPPRRASSLTARYQRKWWTREKLGLHTGQVFLTHFHADFMPALWSCATAAAQPCSGQPRPHGGIILCANWPLETPWTFPPCACKSAKHRAHHRFHLSWF